MKKLFLTLLLSILALTSFAPQAYAKVWTKELVDKVMLESGYKFSICTIDMPYDRSNSADNIFNAQEKDFEANPDSFPCNKQSQEDVLFADITLYFNRAKWGDVSAPEKLIEFQNHLYSVDEYGDVLADPNGKTDIKDIAVFDWFSTIPSIHGVRGTRLINTDPNATDDQKTLPNSNFLIIHDPATGKFSTALFVFNNKVYKFSSMISQVTIPGTLVDYTQSEVTTPISVPILTSIPDQTPTPTPTPDEFANWKKYSDPKYNFSFKYPTDWTTEMKDYPADNQRLINIIKNSSPSVVSLSFTIMNGWNYNQLGGAQYQPKNYSVGGVPAYRMDPPTKEQQTLERYQTNVYFEAPDGHVYVFICTHNWDQNYIDTCNNILSTFKFTQ
jgi:hypothetical protein